MVKSCFVLMPLCAITLVCSAAAAWVDISSTQVNDLKSQGKTIDYPGGGGCAGVAVNRLNGDLYIKIQGQGLWKSADQGTTYTRADNSTVSGRDETGFAWDMDQANPTRMATFSLDGNAGGALDGTTWKSFANVGRNWDFGSVDWVSAVPSVIIVAQHESGGIVQLSTNGGTSWSVMNINVVASGGVDGASTTSMVGVLDANTLIYCKGGGIYRSVNKGGTWSQASTLNTLTRKPLVFKGIAYLGNASGLLVSSDNGATWHQQGGAVIINQGPYFGTDENTMVVINQQGVYKTTNAGQNWTKLPPTIQPGNFDPRWFGHYAYDPVHNLIYTSAMGNPAYKWDLGPVSVSNGKSSSYTDKRLFITRSTIQSGIAINKVEVYLPSGKLMYRQQMAPSNSVTLPHFSNASGSMLMVRASMVDGNVTKLWR
jgi:photosystem II stability/assembly factor-like uncharacterized protein